MHPPVHIYMCGGWYQLPIQLVEVSCIVMSPDGQTRSTTYEIECLLEGFDYFLPVERLGWKTSDIPP